MKIAWKFENRKYIVKSKGFVYMFINENKEIVYIGKTYGLSIDNRIKTHFCEDKKGKLSNGEIKNIKYIMFSTFDSCADCDIYEVYLINKYKPIWNKDCNTGDKLNIKLPNITFDFYYNIDFNEFYNVNFDKIKFMENKNKKEMKKEWKKLQNIYSEDD